MAFGDERFRPSFSLETLSGIVAWTVELVDALFKLPFYNCFAGEFFVKLQIKFDVEGSTFRTKAADERIVDHIGGGTYFWGTGLLLGLRSLVLIRRHLYVRKTWANGYS